MDAILLISGLVILVGAGDALVRGAVTMSLQLGIPTIIISATVVALGTSAPEMLISVQAALADAREATKLPACFENSSFVHGTRIKYEVPDLLTDLMDVARFLAADARVKATAGDAAGALEDLAAIKRLAAHVSRHPTLVSQMIAIAIDDTAAQVIEPVLAAAATPFPPELISLPVAVREIERDNWMRTWQFEAAFSQSWFTQDPRTAWAVSLNSPGLPLGVIEDTLYRVFLLRQEITGLQKKYEQIIAIARQPYHLVRETLDLLDHRGRGIMTSMSVPNLFEGFKPIASAHAAARLYALTLAAAAFHGRTGRYPQSAAELVPAYIAEIPTDPFSGKPLRLKPIAGGLILYSVGSDGKDNGGKRGSFNTDAEEGEDIVFRLGAAYKK